jgi:hypothetical protein
MGTPLGEVRKENQDITLRLILRKGVVRTGVEWI